MAKRISKKSGAARSAPRKTVKRKAAAGARTTKKVVKKAARAVGAVKKAKVTGATAKKASASKKRAAAKSSAPVRARGKGASKKGTPSSPRTKTRSTAPAATSQDPIQFPQEKPLPKTYLTAKELRTFRELLLEKRAELAGDVERLSNEALSNDARGQGEQSAMPIHMADLGSDNWEQEFTLGLLANEESLIREIDDALLRIEKKAYGICLATGKKISQARLRAKPWAKYCIEYARAREEGRAI